MGTISTRKNKDGSTKYRAQIRVKRGDIEFSESRTFSKKSLAAEWIRRRETEIESNPDILTGSNKTNDLTLCDAILRYLGEVEFGRSKRAGMRFISTLPIARKQLESLTRQDYADHTISRRNGIPSLAIEPCSASTATQDLLYLKSLLDHVDLVWGMRVNIAELEQAIKGLRRSRMIGRSQSRDRLPTAEELKKLYFHFSEKWKRSAYTMPVHLIMWLAIYTCRRESEIGRLLLSDYDAHNSEWLIRDLKNPNGSKGNNKKFTVSTQAKAIIDELLKPEVRQKMLKNGGDASLLVPINLKSMAARWQEGVKICGIEDLRFHDFRHEGATRLAEDGLTIPQIQQYTLHDSWSSLSRYVNLKRRAKRLDFDDVFLA